MKKVLLNTGLSRATIYNRIAKGEFPRQVTLGGRAVGWLKTEVDNSINERIHLRPGSVTEIPERATAHRLLLRTISGDGELVFPGEQNSSKSMSNMTILKALERMGYKGPHDWPRFRGVASTIMHEQGYNHEHIELQLANAPRNAVSAAYNHALYLEPRARMMQDWANFMDESRRGGKVLPLPWLRCLSYSSELLCACFRELSMHV